jgi:hypothetical protein
MKKIIIDFISLAFFVFFTVISLISLFDGLNMLINYNNIFSSFWTKERLIIAIVLSFLIFAVSSFFALYKLAKIIKTLKKSNK